MGLVSPLPLLNETPPGFVANSWAAKFSLLVLSLSPLRPRAGSCHPFAGLPVLDLILA